MRVKGSFQKGFLKVATLLRWAPEVSVGINGVKRGTNVEGTASAKALR